MVGFADETYIDIASGRGGHGCVSFRREKYVERGGPDGGDGGKGGDLVFVVKQNLRTLAHLKTIRSFRAENGQNGMGARCFGRNGRDMEVEVPPGTIIKDAETGDVIKDLTGLERYVFLKGGRGGLGNWHFRSSTRQAPRFAQPGEEGIEMRVGLELHLIADIGFVGFPNAGKSSLINMLTNARSKVAPYPFTTKIPHLGMMRFYGQDVTLADIPGLISGASKGEGMGFKFLRHITRTSALAYFIDMSESSFSEKYELLRNELGTYSQDLLSKPEILIGTKLDEPGAEENFEVFKEKYKDKEVYGITILEEETLRPVMKAFADIVKNNAKKIMESVTDDDASQIQMSDDGEPIIREDRSEYLAEKTDDGEPIIREGRSENLAEKTDDGEPLVRERRSDDLSEVLHGGEPLIREGRSENLAEKTDDDEPLIREGSEPYRAREKRESEDDNE